MFGVVAVNASRSRKFWAFPGGMCQAVHEAVLMSHLSVGIRALPSEILEWLGLLCLEADLGRALLGVVLGGFGWARCWG